MRIKDMTDNELITELIRHENMLIEDPMMEYDTNWLENIENIVSIMQERGVYGQYEEQLIEDDVDNDFENYH